MGTRPLAGGLLALALGAAGLSACGGSPPAATPTGSPGGPTSPGAATSPSTPTTQTTASQAPSGAALSRTALAARAGAICAAATAQGRKLVVPPNLTSDAHAAAAYFDQAVPPLDAETKAFQALTPAPAASAQWEALLGAQVALDRLAEGYRQTAHAGRQTSLADIRQLVTVGKAIANAAARLGARCSAPGT